METLSMLVEPRGRRRSRGVLLPLRVGLVAACALGLSVASPAAFAEPMNAGAPAVHADTNAPAHSNAMPDPADPATQSPGLVTGFIPIDPATQPQAGETHVQVPSTATNQEVKGEYGVGLALIVIAVLLTAAVLVGLYMVVVRRSWDSHDPPVSQRRLSE
jgi:hypothetical protein